MYTEFSRIHAGEYDFLEDLFIFSVCAIRQWQFPLRCMAALAHFYISPLFLCCAGVFLPYTCRYTKTARMRHPLCAGHNWLTDLSLPLHQKPPVYTHASVYRIVSHYIYQLHLPIKRYAEFARTSARARNCYPSHASRDSVSRPFSRLRSI